VKRDTLSERAIILAPRGRDAVIAAAVLREAGLEAESCNAVADLIRALDLGAGLVIVTEEALGNADLTPISVWLQDQEEWSDLPFILLTSGAGGLERNPSAKRYLDIMGNVSFLERPFHPTTLVSLTRSALRGRRRQYEARKRLSALAESQARFRNIADHSPVMMWVTDASGVCTYLNRLWYDFTGQAAEQAEGFGWLEAVHPDDRGWSEEIFLAANARRESFRLEYRLRRHDGTYRWAIDAARPRFGERNEFLGYVGSVIDIDDRREMEDRLREGEDRLRMATESAAIGTWDFDPTTGVLRWDERCKALFGLPPDAAVDYDTFLAGMHPDDRSASDAAVQQALAPDGQQSDFALEYRTIGVSDGLERWIAARGRAFFDGAGEDRRARRFIGTVVDITDSKRAKELLELRMAEALAERKLLADIVEGTDAFVQVADFDYRWLAINKASSDEFKRIYGIRPKVGDCMLDVLAGQPEYRDMIKDAWGRALAGESFTMICESGDAERERRHYEMKFNILKGADGQRIGAYQFAYDITERIQEQRRLSEAEEQLRQSQKMEAMGQLTGGVAHDFNNLLTPIVGALDMLQRKALGGEREQRLIVGAAQSADRARTLVQRLLAFARRQPLQPTAVDVARLVTGMSELIASTTGPQIRVAVETTDNLPPAKADANQLEMALLNLSVNARDAMPDGGTLRVSATKELVGPGHRSKLRAGDYLRLSVADTGIGMDEATMTRAVEPFFSTKGVGKGTGLGLSMVHGLASQLGGALTIRSRLGIGTNVELWLPVSDASAATPGEVAEATAPLTEVRTALLVDDEELVRLSTAEMLGDLGYTVMEASSAEEALKLIRSGLRPEVLVSDHQMPGMKGTDLAKILLSELPQLQVLIISGYAESEGFEPDLPRLSKPFRNAELAATLAALGPRRGEDRTQSGEYKFRSLSDAT
jgi:PAS domain S-box-containing protein